MSQTPCSSTQVEPKTSASQLHRALSRGYRAPQGCLSLTSMAGAGPTNNAAFCRGVRMFWGETERYVYQSLMLSCLCFLWLQGTR